MPELATFFHPMSGFFGHNHISSPPASPFDQHTFSSKEDRRTDPIGEAGKASSRIAQVRSSARQIGQPSIGGKGHPFFSGKGWGDCHHAVKKISESQPKRGEEEGSSMGLLVSRIILAMGVLFLGIVGHAEKPALAADSEEPIQQLREVTVNAEKIYPAPGAPTSRQGVKDVEELEGKDVGFVLKAYSAPGVTGKRRGSLNLDPVIRGLSQDRINVMINGMKQWGAGPFRMDPPTSLIDVTSLESIEVIRGPYTVTRGPSTIAGAINLVTKAPEFFDTFTLKSRTGLQFSQGAQGGWSARPTLWGGNRDVGFRLSFGYQDYGDYQTGDDTTIQSSFLNRSVTSDVMVKTADNQRLRMSFSIDSDRDAFFQALPLTAEIDDAYMGSATYQILNPSPLIERLEVTGYYTHVHHVMSNARKPTTAMFITDFPLDSGTIGGRVQANLNIEKGLLSIGGDYYHLLRTGTLTNRSPTTAAIVGSFNAWPSAKIQDVGIFGEFQRPLTRKWRFILGSRVDIVHADASPDGNSTNTWTVVNGNADPSQTEVNVSANGRLIFSPIPTLDVFLGVGRAVRTADAVERYFRGPSPGVATTGGIIQTVGNPGLDPEKSIEVDLGAKGTVGALTFEGSFFFNSIHDFILSTLTANPAGSGVSGATIRKHNNIDQAQLFGGDFLTTYQLTPEWSIIGSFQYVRGKNITQSKDLPEIPPLDTSWGVRYEHTFSHTSGASTVWIQPMIRGVQKQSRFDAGFGELATPGYVLVNLRSGIKMPRGYQFVLNVENLLDHSYRNHLTTVSPFPITLGGTTGPLNDRLILEPGRTILIGIQGPIPGLFE